MNQRPSRKFNPSSWLARLVPVMLVLLLLALVVTLAIIFVSVP